MPQLSDKFWSLEESLGDVVLERFSEIHGASLALITKEHHFTLGTPGIAKTMLADQLVQRIDGMTEEDYFSILLMKSTPTEELFGVYDMKELMEGVYKRQTKGMLPNAKIATIDECFKGSAATLNGLLWLLNERWFKNHGEDKNRPLMTAFLMSNELAESDGLNALWDRLLFRYHAEAISDTSNFMKMMTAELDPDPEKILTLEDIETAHAQAKLVKIPDEVLVAIKSVKDSLKDKGIEVTDRRWRRCISVIRAEAWMRGLEVAEISDLKPLAHVLWNDINEIPDVQSEIRNLADPHEAEAQKLYDAITETYTTYKEQRESTEDRHIRTKAGLRMFQKYKGSEEEFTVLQTKIDARRSDILTKLRKKLDRISEELAEGLKAEKTDD